MIPQCSVKSAVDKNFSPNANSTKPNTTFIVVIQLPELGRLFSQLGNAANNVKGRAKATEKPNIPIEGAKKPTLTASTKRVPIIGPVQEKETKQIENAPKKVPINPPLSEAGFVGPRRGKGYFKISKKGDGKNSEQNEKSQVH